MLQAVLTCGKREPINFMVHMFEGVTTVYFKALVMPNFPRDSVASKCPNIAVVGVRVFAPSPALWALCGISSGGSCHDSPQILIPRKLVFPYDVRTVLDIKHLRKNLVVVPVDD